MFCEKCGKEMSTLMIDVFNHDGSDGYYTHCVEEHEENAVTIDTTKNWTGYELSNEERVDTIKCPYCRQFPFESTEIQIEKPVRIICFKSDKHKIAKKHPDKKGKQYEKGKQYVETGLLLENATFMFDEALGYCKCVLVEDIEDSATSAVVEEKNINDLLFVIRSNMTSITRHVKHNWEKHPTLTLGQFLDQNAKYRELAIKAVDNILSYINPQG